MEKYCITFGKLTAHKTLKKYMKFFYSLNFIICLSLILLVSNAKAQNYFYKTFAWEKQPTVYKPQNDEKLAELVLVRDNNILEVAYDKDGQAVIYETHHLIYHVNTQKAIETINKVYIPTSQVNEEIELKARCITPENKIILFNTDNVKRVDNLEDSGPYTIFSVDGVDVGCDVEYYFTNKHTFHPYAFYKIQNKMPLVQYNFKVISPKNLVYETRSFNGLNPFTKDATDTLKNVINFEHKNMPAVDEEKYSATNANKYAFSIQLAYNTDKSKSKFYTWETIAKWYYNDLFVIDKAQQKAVEKVIEKNKINKAETPEERIRALENLIKLQYDIGVNNKETDLISALQAKAFNESSSLRLYIAAFRKLEIPFELVFTTSRLNKKFDAKYPSYSFLDEILFYFPTIDKYTSPTEVLSRIGFPNPNTLANDGLFIKEITIGDIGAPSSRIKQIPVNDYIKSAHNINIKTTIDANTFTAHLEVEQNLMGYNGYYIQPIYELLNAEQKLEVNKGYYTLGKPETAKNTLVSNTDKESIFIKPFKVNYTQDIPDVIESAGDKIIFKIGELIGTQSELYQAKKRVTEGDIYSTHSLKRILEITIPDNYKITNADEIKIDKRCIIDGKDAAQFVSEYTLEGNKMTVTVYEDYRVIKYPLANFEGFKDVINAAADFNKKTLVFEKK